MQAPEEIPTWLQTLIALVSGGALVSWYKVWAENRRLLKKDYRETLVDRISELERTVEGLYRRLEIMSRAEGALQEENRQLRERVEELESDFREDEE